MYSNQVGKTFLYLNMDSNYKQKRHEGGEIINESLE
jgi:hypothetical protein